MGMGMGMGMGMPGLADPSTHPHPPTHPSLPFRPLKHTKPGLIIGPRGATQKEMERTTNTKISIRGKGSVKEGARSAASKGPADDDNDELHVYVCGEREEDVRT